jgi:hypothetical protein
LHTLRETLAPVATGLVLAGNARLPRTGPPVVREDEIRRELGTLFDILRLREFFFDPLENEEEQHLGWSCLLRRKPG